MENINKSMKKLVNKRYKPKHKHWFQFIEKHQEYKIRTVIPTGKVFAEFVCICGSQKIVEIKE